MLEATDGAGDGAGDAVALARSAAGVTVVSDFGCDVRAIARSGVVSCYVIHIVMLTRNIPASRQTVCLRFP